MPTSPAKPETQRDRAYHQLRRLLILQQVPEGIRLRETEWSQRLGVNRSALREAFVRLCSTPKTAERIKAMLETGRKVGSRIFYRRKE